MSRNEVRLTFRQWFSQKRAEKYLKIIAPEVDQILIDKGYLRRVNGRLHWFDETRYKCWEIQQEILRERYNIEWLTPQQLNPHARYD